jgi:hypothetical protein
MLMLMFNINFDLKVMNLDILGINIIDLFPHIYCEAMKGIYSI